MFSETLYDIQQVSSLRPIQFNYFNHFFSLANHALLATSNDIPFCMLPRTDLPAESPCFLLNPFASFFCLSVNPQKPVALGADADADADAGADADADADADAELVVFF